MHACTYPGTQITNVGSGLCLDIAGGQSANNIQLRQWACLNNASQTFAIVPATVSSTIPGGLFNIRTSAGKCLSIQGDSIAVGAAIVQWTCTDSWVQAFAILQFADGG